MNRIALVALLGFIVMLSACKKEDSVTVTQTEEPLELGFKMVVNDTEIITDAVAAYCQNDSLEFIIIANKQENLNFPLETQNFEANDFVYFTGIGENTWGFGGQALGDDITGIDGILSIMFSNAELKIESNDGEIVVGESSGILSDGNNAEYPYTMTFVAEIVEESDFCE